MKHTFITLFFIAITLNTFGQRKERHERIQALKVAFITEKLELTPEEAQQFWPVFNAIEKQKEKESSQFREVSSKFKSRQTY